MPAKTLTKEQKTKLVSLVKEFQEKDKAIQQAMKQIEEAKLGLSTLLEKVGELAGTEREVYKDTVDKVTGEKTSVLLGKAWTCKLKIAGDLHQLKARWDEVNKRFTYYTAVQRDEDTITVM